MRVVGTIPAWYTLSLYRFTHTQSPHVQGACSHPNVPLLTVVSFDGDLRVVNGENCAAVSNSVDVQHSHPPHTLSNITPHQLVRGGGGPIVPSSTRHTSPVLFPTPDIGRGPICKPNNGALRRPHLDLVPLPLSYTLRTHSHSHSPSPFLFRTAPAYSAHTTPRYRCVRGCWCGRVPCVFRFVVPTSV